MKVGEVSLESDSSRLLHLSCCSPKIFYMDQINTNLMRLKDKIIYNEKFRMFKPEVLNVELTASEVLLRSCFSGLISVS